MSAAERRALALGVARARGRSPGRVLARALLCALAVGLSAMFMTPFLWALSGSLKTPFETTAIPPAWLPASPQWVNYRTIVTVIPFMTFARNTFVLTGANMVAEVISVSAVAYGFARFRFPGRDVLFLLLLSKMMLPREVTIIPQYVLFNYLGWLDTYFPLIVPHALAGSSFGVFLLRQFFLTIPHELDDAARVDGASSVRIFWNVILPLAKPALAAVAIFAFIGNWNSFWEPLIYLNTESKLPLSVGLTIFQAGGAVGNLPKTHLLLAYTVLMTLPVLVVFFGAQRYFIQGVVLSGLKG